jgi:uncharacterized protein (TIGR03435 family)
METVRFDIIAKFPPDAKAEDRSVMLRTLLEDSLKLAVHRESKELPGYALVVGKRFKLQPVEAGESGTSTNGGRVVTLTAKNISMAGLADVVTRRLGQMVVDKTGLTGVYDLELRWTNDDQVASSGEADAPPTIFTALQETLGLRLQAQKVPTPMVVVDHVERAPIEN